MATTVELGDIGTLETSSNSDKFLRNIADGSQPVGGLPLVDDSSSNMDKLLNYIAANGIVSGTNGQPGAKWFNGTNIILQSQGSNGDYFLHNTTGDIYEKQGDIWNKVANIKGTQWLTGQGGPEGFRNDVGNNGDCFLQTTTGNVYQKQNGTWNSQPIINLKGEKGDRGEQGPAGPSSTIESHIPALTEFLGTWQQLHSNEYNSFSVHKLNGIVYLQGAITNATTPMSDSNIYRLPTGFSPAKTLLFSTITINNTSNYAQGAIKIGTDGVIKYISGHTNIFNLSGICFVAGK